MDSFSARLNATEGSYFNSQQQLSLKRHVQKLIEQGTLPKSLLEKIGDVPSVHSSYDVPVTVVKSRPASEVRSSCADLLLAQSHKYYQYPMLSLCPFADGLPIQRQAT